MARRELALIQNGKERNDDIFHDISILRDGDIPFASIRIFLTARSFY